MPVHFSLGSSFAVAFVTQAAEGKKPVELYLLFVFEVVLA
jgi:hypothetical protein